MKDPDKFWTPNCFTVSNMRGILERDTPESGEEARKRR